MTEETRTTRAIQTLRDTIPTSEKGITAPNQVSPLDAWLADVWAYYPWEQNKPLTLDEALQVAAFLICADVVSQDIGKSTLYLRRKVKGGSEIVDPSEHWLARMLALEPNPWHTWQEFKEMLVLHLCCVQNGFWAKKYNRDQSIDYLVPVLPGRARVFVSETAPDYIYEVERLTPNEKMMLRGFGDVLLNDEMIHFRGRMYDGLFGYSTLEAGAKTMGLARSIQDYQSRLYSNDGATRGVFEMPNEQALSEVAFKRLKEQLATRWAAARDRGVPIVLEEGMKFNGVTMNASEAEVSKGMDSAIEDVARLFRVPPHKMMHLQAVKYENLATLDRTYAQETLIPIAGRIERRMERSLLTQEERLQYEIRFDRSEMIVTDVEQEAMLTKVLLLSGAMTVDEARMRQGLNPLPNGAGKTRLVPANYSLVDEKNKPILASGGQTEPEQNEDGDIGLDEDEEKAVADIISLRTA